MNRPTPAEVIEHEMSIGLVAFSAATIAMELIERLRIAGYRVVHESELAASAPVAPVEPRKRAEGGVVPNTRLIDLGDGVERFVTTDRTVNNSRDLRFAVRYDAHPLSPWPAPLPGTHESDLFGVPLSWQARHHDADAFERWISEYQAAKWWSLINRTEDMGS